MSTIVRFTITVPHGLDHKKGIVFFVCSRGLCSHFLLFERPSYFLLFERPLQCSLFERPSTVSLFKKALICFGLRKALLFVVIRKALIFFVARKALILVVVRKALVCFVCPKGPHIFAINIERLYNINNVFRQARIYKAQDNTPPSY